MNLKSILAIVMLVVSMAGVKAEIIGDSIVAIYNDWNLNDEFVYETFSSRTRIKGNDSIVESSSTLKNKILFKEILPDGDYLFEYTTQLPAIGDLGEREPLRKMYEKIYEMSEKPQIFITDSLGEMKDIYNYDALMGEMDSCRVFIKDWIETLDMPEPQKNALMSGCDNMLKQSMSKESIMENARMFKYYGSVYEFGTQTYDVKLPVPLFNNKEVDAEVTFTCDVLKTTEDYELIGIRSDVIYNTDQLMDMFSATYLNEDQIRESGLLNPDRPYISLTATEEYIIEAGTGTIIQITTEKKTILPDGGRIDYSITRLMD